MFVLCLLSRATKGTFHHLSPLRTLHMRVLTILCPTNIGTLYILNPSSLDPSAFSEHFVGRQMSYWWPCTTKARPAARVFAHGTHALRALSREFSCQDDGAFLNSGHVHQAFSKARSRKRSRSDVVSRKASRVPGPYPKRCCGLCSNYSPCNMSHGEQLITAVSGL